MKSRGKTVTISFNIRVIEGFDGVDSTLTDCCDCKVDFTEEEVALIRRLVAAKEHDAETNLMPILESAAPELYRRIDRKAREAVNEFFWLEAIRRTEHVTGYGGLSMSNYYRDVENGDFMQSKNCQSQFRLENDEGTAFLEWIVRELKRESNEYYLLFPECGREELCGANDKVCEYRCHIPDEFLTKND